MKTRHILLFILLITLLNGGCTRNDSPENSSKTRTMTISMRASDQDAADPNELINSWWMVFVDANDKIRLVLDRDLSEPVSYDEVEFEISRGTYTIYAFANIKPGDIGFSAETGDDMPQLPEVWQTVGKIDDLIPMTGKLENVRFSDTASDHFTVEVVRMWAKLCFEFTTDTKQGISVTGISMIPALTHKVSFLPDYSTLGSAPVLPDGVTCSTLTRNMNLSVPASGETVSETFYVLESTASGHPTGHYPLSFAIKHGGKDYQLNALAYQLEHINRNDFVTIPVLITDWKVNLNVLFYPPIGGYPAVMPESNNDEFYARFGSGGKFVIRPEITKSSGEQVAEKDIDVTLKTSDPSGILKVQPVRDPKTSEIIGEIHDSNLGIACVDLKFKVRTDALEHEILRRFYVIRQ